MDISAGLYIHVRIYPLNQTVPLSLTHLQASKDIVRVVEWKDVECYTGNQYKRFYKAPGPHCFTLIVSSTLLCVLGLGYKGLTWPVLPY